MRSSTLKHSGPSPAEAGTAAVAGPTDVPPLQQSAGGGPSFGRLAGFWIEALRLRWLPGREDRRTLAQIEERLGMALGDALAIAERHRLARAALLHRAVARRLPLPAGAIMGERRTIPPGTHLLTLSTWFDEELRNWLGQGSPLTALRPPLLSGASEPGLADQLPSGGKWFLLRYVRRGTTSAVVHWGGEVTGTQEQRVAETGDWLDGRFRENPALYRWAEP